MYDKAWLLSLLEETRDRTLAMVDTLADEQLQVPYHPGVNPPLWEMGHAAFFYEVFVFNLLDGTPSHNPAMDDFWDSFHIDHHDRWSREFFPGRDKTRDYFNIVYDRVAERICEQPLGERELYLYRYAIYHQHMHIESMTWCRQTVGYPAPPGVEVQASEANPPGGTDLGDAEIPAGTWLIGMPGESDLYARDDFAFDAEKPRHPVFLEAFRISRTPVSNGEFLAFVEDGGYRRPELWSFGGRKWLQTETDVALVHGATTPVMREPRHPLYWRYHEGQWQQRLFDRWHPLNPAAPVLHVSYWEAEAWCNWAGRRLPTEAEWEVAALGNRPDGPFRRFPWGNQPPSPENADLDARRMGRLAVTDLSAGDSPFGCRQMVGTAWEWTSEQFLPYDGFKVDMYPFMSTLQFGDHKVTRGGSCATSSVLIRGTYRQAYLPQRNDVYTGFRSCAL
ncbi:iron(II)-dependent oxidoreductase [Marinobacter daqiaonensis]|uniref:Iron(II)-dependent oxidoreductase n=1 Tax=Marinobacter daqiaonensis TaxID=650891 RepID=A0A1I6JU16_9GAMM|nr:selenoneine synthase SenA [Marinobacter daqiaonensis]SFR82388.1 iron(II)-dependent oxidoreductase [Marinobacter daqiaonensis]